MFENKIKFILLVAALCFTRNASAEATPWPAFVTVSNLNFEKNKVEIPNMPRVLAQHEFGICYSMASTTLAQWYMCKEDHIPDCSNADPGHEISALSMVAWARPNTQVCKIENGKYFDEFGTEVKQHYCGPKIAGSVVSSFSNIGLFGGAAVAALINSHRAFNFKTESCYRSEKLLARHGRSIEDTVKFDIAIERLFEENKGRIDDCASCL